MFSKADRIIQRVGQNDESSVLMRNLFKRCISAKPDVLMLESQDY